MVNQRGGIDRLKAYLERNTTFHKTAVLVDAGDTFFSAPKLNPGRVWQEKLRAETLADFFKMVELAAIAPGERDFALGLDELRKLGSRSGATIVACNLTNDKGEPLFAPSVMIERAGKKVGIVGVASGESLNAVPGVKVLPPLPSIKEAVADLKKQGAEMLVLLSHSGLEADRGLAAEAGVDFIVSAHTYEILSAPLFVGQTGIVQAHYEGQQVGVLEWDPASKKMVRHELIDLDTSYRSDNAATKLMDSYREAVRKIATEDGAKAAPVVAERPFVAHPFFCKNCHEPQYEFWAKTKHASAYLVLFAKNEHFNPECISCHSLGFMEREGYPNIAEPLVLAEPSKKKEPFVETLMKTVFAADKKGPLDSRTQKDRYKKLHARYDKEVRALEKAGKLQKLFIGVQCEHCHGNRHGHPDPNVATVKKVSESSCRSCHTPPNAPEFDPKMIARVACPPMQKAQKN